MNAEEQATSPSPATSQLGDRGMQLVGYLFPMLFGYLALVVAAVAEGTVASNLILGPSELAPPTPMAAFYLGVAVVLLTAGGWLLSRVGPEPQQLPAKAAMHALRRLLATLFRCDRVTALWIVGALVLGLVNVYVSFAATTVAGTSPSPADTRLDTLQAGAIARAVGFGYLVAPLAEEVGWRGGLLLLLAWWPPTWRPRLRLVIVTAAAVIVTLHFGWAHAESGMHAAVSAGATGIVYLLLAVGSRSLIPAMVCHGTYNTLTALARIGVL